ncbi:MAG: TIGR02757 family protein [Chitinophagales bacterium]
MKKIKQLLDEKYLLFNQTSFIKDDPIQIPHLFSKQQDVEIMAFFAATLAWGQRKTIIKNCHRLVDLFDNAPHDFILNHQEKELKRFLDFKHRTFNATDLLYFIAFLKHHYQNNDTLETAFTKNMQANDSTIENGLIGFHDYFCSLDFFPTRTRKHIATPIRKSACKRINMLLRWMVRPSDTGVDFGLWENIKTSQLLIPLDVHVDRVARELGLLSRKQRDFKAVLELTENLRKLDTNDPVKYDFSLFGMGILQKG